MSEKSTEIKTFLPKTPIEFSSTLISTLDQSKETNYTRQQYAQQYIDKQVSLKIKELEKKKTFELDEKLKSLLLPNESKTSVSVAQLDEKLSNAMQNLQKINAKKPEKTILLQNAENNVTECLLKNKGKPLNCWEEVQNFKQVAGDY